MTIPGSTVGLLVVGRRTIPGSTVGLLVVGRRTIPVIVDEQTAKREPDLAVLSAMARGGEAPELAARAARIAIGALAGVVQLDDSEPCSVSI